MSMFLSSGANFVAQAPSFSEVMRDLPQWGANPFQQAVAANQQARAGFVRDALATEGALARDQQLADNELRLNKKRWDREDDALKRSLLFNALGGLGQESDNRARFAGQAMQSLLDGSSPLAQLQQLNDIQQGTTSLMTGFGAGAFGRSRDYTKGVLEGTG